MVHPDLPQHQTKWLAEKKQDAFYRDFLERERQEIQPKDRVLVYPHYIPPQDIFTFSDFPLWFQVVCQQYFSIQESDLFSCSLLFVVFAHFLIFSGGQTSLQCLYNHFYTQPAFFLSSVAFQTKHNAWTWKQVLLYINEKPHRKWLKIHPLFLAPLFKAAKKDSSLSTSLFPFFVFVYRKEEHTQYEKCCIASPQEFQHLTQQYQTQQYTEENEVRVNTKQQVQACLQELTTSQSAFRFFLAA